MKQLLSVIAIAAAATLSTSVLAENTFRLEYHGDYEEGNAGQHISVDLCDYLDAVTPKFEVLEIDCNEVTWTPTQQLPRGFRLKDGVISGTPKKRGAYTYQVEAAYKGESVIGTSSFAIY